jgi:dolichol-phosphate mannosyltransferase
VTPLARRAVGVVALVDALRLAGAVPLGLGDAEALYAAYAQHLQGGYLDHPPLIGWLDAAVLAVWPSAYALRVTALALFTLSAWLLFRLARALFDEDAALWAVVALCVLPVFHLGGLAASPDAPLAPLWLACLLAAWAAARRLAAEQAPPWSWVAWRGALLGGLLGAAFLAKYSAAALAPVLAVVAWRLAGTRRAVALAVGAGAALLAASPVVLWNASHGWASLLHRFVWSQPDPGASLRNLGALAGGQLLYLSPIAAVGLAWAVARGWRDRADAAVRFCLLATLVPFAVLAAVCLWSRVAEPHWPTPAYYALLPLAGRLLAGASRRVLRLARAAVWTAAAMDAVVYVAVLTPVLPALVPGSLYVARHDIANELYGWDEVGEALRRQAPRGSTAAGGSYVMCAQLAWSLRGSGIPVSCWTVERTDFDYWSTFPEGVAARPVVFVSDERYPERPSGACGAAAPVPGEVVVRRGGVIVRRFALTAYPPGAVRFPRPKAGEQATACPGASSAPDYAPERGGR